MTAKETMLEVYRNQGRADALALRKEAEKLTQTEIIDREESIPAFQEGRDYSAWPAQSPVTDDGQVWLLLQPYNSTHHPGKPKDLRTLWGLAHTKNPKKAKPWVAPYGTSGLYYRYECYRKDDGTVMRCITEKTNFNADEYPPFWEVVAV